MSILLEKEYNIINQNIATIACLMMVKNEEKRIHVSLESIAEYIEALVIYDTGSTDNTINIIQNFCEKNKLNLYMIQGEFKDFSTSRNVLLDYADKRVNTTFQLLLDCNDELKNGEDLRLFIEEYKEKDFNMFMTRQEWKSQNISIFKNIRFIRSKNDIRFYQPVHEYLDAKNKKIALLPDNIYLYQDRTLDDDKSFKRFSKDYEILLKEHIAQPNEKRILFYLAQTCECLGKYDDAIFYSKLRIDQETIDEEVFLSYNRIAVCSYRLNKNCQDLITYSLRALELFPRIEPLIQIAEVYILNKNWRLAYMFLKEACTLEYPKNALLFVSKELYDYQKWHLLGIVCYYMNKFEEGKDACLKAINYGKNIEINQANLKRYNNE
jgi:hypothetical protein